MTTIFLAVDAERGCSSNWNTFGGCIRLPGQSFVVSCVTSVFMHAIPLSMFEEITVCCIKPYRECHMIRWTRCYLGTIKTPNLVRRLPTPI